ncbi:MAG: hypothetical protein AB3F67_1260 [Candidatus Phytoplasma solani]
MNNKKSSAPIIIILLILIISGGIGFYFWMNKTPKFETPQTTPNTNDTTHTPHTPTTYGNSAHKPEKGEEELDETKKEETQDQSTQPKFTITQANFDKVKEYVFSETDDKTLLPNDLSEQEKTEISQIQNSWNSSLGYLKRQQNPINELINQINKHQTQINSIKDQYPSLKSQKANLESKETEKNDKINSLKEKQQQFKYLPNQSESVRTTRRNNYNRLKDEIEKLQDERIEIVGEIDDIKVKIGKLESKQEMYEGMLSNAIKLRDSLKRSYDKSEKEYQNQIDSKLNALYQITSTEG